MKRFRVILAGLLALIFAAVAVPFIAQFFDAGSITQLLAGAGTALATIVPIFGELQTSLSIKEKRGELHKLMTDLHNTAKGEKRDFSTDELAKYNEYNDQFNALGDRLKIVENQERRMAEMAGSYNPQGPSDNEKRDLKKYSLFRAIKAKVEGNSLDGIEAEMHQEAVKEAREAGQNVTGLGIPSLILSSHSEKRAMSATGTTSTTGDQGGMLIPTDKEGLIMALRPILVLAGLGAKTFGGMVGNLDLVKGTSTSVAWEGENTDADETSSTTSKISVTPRRLAAFIKIGKQLLAQTSPGIQDDLMNDILLAVAQAVEVAAINGSGSSNQPTGLLSTSGIGSVAGGTDGSNPTYSHITQLEAKVEIANANMNTLAYITNPKVKNQLKNTKLDSGSGLYVWGPESNMLNGYKAVASNLVPSTLTKGTSSGNASAIIFGDFSNLHIYNWAGLDITVDPYTLAGNNQLKLTVNSFWDVAVKHPGAFAAMVDALTTL